jgi:hypothetical protein
LVTPLFFHLLNRIADALGTDLEPEMPLRPEGWSRSGSDSF